MDIVGGNTMTFYSMLVMIHIFSAIIGLGPGFVMTFIVTKATTMTELRHAFLLRNKLHIFVMLGGILLFVTGLWMGFIHPRLFTEGWYVVSLFLFLLTLAAGPLLLKPLSAPIRVILDNQQGDEIPSEYNAYAKRLFTCENILNGIFVVIIFLMIMKPF